MPPRFLSRHTFTEGLALTDQGDERLFLTDREAFPFRQLNDNRQHVVKAGDTLFSLAGRYFRGLPRPAGLWWVIADFQVQQLHDPTVELPVGSVLVIPSRRTVEQRVFGEARRLTG